GESSVVGIFYHGRPRRTVIRLAATLLTIQIRQEDRPDTMGVCDVRPRSRQPCLDAQSRYLLKVLEVCRQYERVMNERDGRDVEVHGADAYAGGAQLFESIGGCVVKGKNGPSALELA